MSSTVIPPNRFVAALAERTGRVVIVDESMGDAIEAQRTEPRRGGLTAAGRRALDVRLQASWVEARKVVLEAYEQEPDAAHGDMPDECLATLAKLASVYDETRAKVGGSK